MTTVIPDFLAHLPVHAGFPVPYFTQFVDGVPDFRIIDPLKIQNCIHGRLCGICGRRLGERSWFVGGPLSKANHLFIDPPMHEDCVRFAALNCPFLARRHQYSDRPIPDGVAIVAAHTTENRPTESWMLCAYTKKTAIQVIKERGAILFLAGRYIKQELIYKEVA